MRNNTTRLLVEGALLIAMSTVLSYIKLFQLSTGGSISLEMLPIVIMGFRNGTKWGVLTGFTHGILQMIIGFSNVLYCATLISQIGCILLDYVLAFSVLGLAPLFTKLFRKNLLIGYVAGATIAGTLRFICSFLSGWLLWGSYAPEGMNVAYYSLIYNGSYMLPNTIILIVATVILAESAPKIFLKDSTI